MRFLSIIFALIAVMAIHAHAENPNSLEEFTYQGKTYKSCSFSMKTPTKASVIHSDGVFSIPAKDLPLDIAKALGFDRHEAAAHTAAEQELADARKQRIEKIRKYVAENGMPKPLYGKIFQVTNGGVLVKPIPYTRMVKKMVDVKKSYKSTSGTALSGRRTTSVPYTVRELREVRERVDSWANGLDTSALVFVRCNTQDMVDDQIVLWKSLFADGAFSYNNTLGAQQTIKAFKISPFE